MKSRLMKTISPITEEARYIILSSLTDLPFLSRPVPNVILQLHAVVLLQVGGDNLLLLSSSWTKYQKLISIIEERYLSDTLWNIIMQYLHLHKIFRQRFLPLLWNNVGRHVELYCLDPVLPSSSSSALVQDARGRENWRKLFFVFVPYLACLLFFALHNLSNRISY